MLFWNTKKGRKKREILQNFESGTSENRKKTFNGTLAFIFISKPLTFANFAKLKHLQNCNMYFPPLKLVSQALPVEDTYACENGLKSVTHTLLAGR